MSPPLFLPFDESPTGEARALLGGKAAGLHRLRARGAPVPAGFTLTTASFAAVLAANQLGGAARGVRDALAAGDRADAVARGRELADRLAAAEVGSEVAAALADGLAGLGPPGPLAVRSSGVLEDAEGASFAGLHDTFLEVEPEEVGRKVVRCFASIFGERVLGYLADRRVAPDELAMAVVVQRMVPCDFAGVLFTLDPTTGREERALVELVPGTGEALVSGRVDPARVAFEEAPDAGTFRVAEETWTAGVSREARGALRDLLLAELLPRARDLAVAEGLPLDIEFGVAAGELHLLQARPITAVAFAPELGEWTNADFNEGGVSAGVCSPFMWSLYDLIWETHLPEYLVRIGLMPPDEVPGHHWGRTFFGVPYWNVGAVKAALERVPGYDERNFDEDLGIEKDYGPEGPRGTPTTPGTLLRGIGVLVRMYREFGRQRVATEELLRDFEALEARWLGIDLEAAEDGLLFDLYEELVRLEYVRVEGTYFMTIFNSSNAKLEFKSSLDALNADRAEPVPYLDLMSGMRGLRTLESAHDLHRLIAGLRADPEAVRILEGEDLPALVARVAAGPGSDDPLAPVAAYVRKHAHHSRRELDPRVPRWGEDLEFVVARVRQALREYDPARDPEALEDAQHARYLAARARMDAACGWNALRRWWLGSALDRTRGYCWLREETRDRSTRMYRIVRHYTLEVARRLEARGVLAHVDDVFHLAWHEILAAIRGDRGAAEVRELVEARRAWAARWARFPAPREIGAGFRRAPEPEDAGGVLRGVGGAPGVARGPAAVVRDLEESGKLRRGDVLVAEFTDPGWTPLLGMVAAVVTEVGGVLSHAAVIAREYGVPAVLSVRGATRRLADGRELEVDGGRGEVREVGE